MKVFGQEIKFFPVFGIWFLMWGLNSFIYAMVDHTFFEYLVLKNFTHVGNFVGGISLMIFGYILFREHLTWELLEKALSQRNKGDAK